MKFESLPNEILIECFEYLNTVDIFNAFDYLNFRFHNLIRHIPLYLNVGEIKQATLVQFGIKMLLDPKMKKQIISLKLSDKKTFDNSRTLFSFISLNEFSHLRALILSDLHIRTVIKISYMLPSLSNLRYFCLQNSSRGNDIILDSLSTSTIRTLSIPTLADILPATHLFTSLVNLTVSSCYVNELCDFFKYLPGLQYLDIKYLRRPYDIVSNARQLPHNQAVHLKRLVINNFRAPFDHFEILLQQTPNLKLLKIAADNDFGIVDVYRWRKVINTSLPLLDVFKFKFSLDIEDEDHVILDKFQQFQTKFWHHEHHWYNEYVLHTHRALIYTIPYMSNEYEIATDTKRYFNKSFDSATTFAKVTDLTLNNEEMTNSGEYYFPNAKSLRLSNTRVDENHDYPYLKTKHIKCLKTMVNLPNLICLEIQSECRWKSPSVILQLFKKASNLSSLTVNKTTVFAMFKNRELRKYLTKIIKRLDIGTYNDVEYLDSNESAKMCKILRNMEEFRCDIGSSDNLEMILNQLSKLTHMKVFSYKTSYGSAGNRWLQRHQSELDSYSFTIKCESDDDEFDDDYMYYFDYYNDSD